MEFNMNFNIYMVFDYDIKKGAVSQKGQFTDIFKLPDIVRDVKYMDSFELGLTRNVFIIKDKKNAKPQLLDKENLDIIVMDKMTYPNQVRKSLITKYNDTFDFDELNLQANTPVYFGGVMEREELGPKNPNTGDKTTYTRRYVQCRSLKKNDIVVGRDLKPIYPYKGEYMPDKLFCFLSRPVYCNQMEMIGIFCDQKVM